MFSFYFSGRFSLLFTAPPGSPVTCSRGMYIRVRRRLYTQRSRPRRDETMTCLLVMIYAPSLLATVLSLCFPFPPYPLSHFSHPPFFFTRHLSITHHHHHRHLRHRRPHHHPHLLTPRATRRAPGTSGGWPPSPCCCCYRRFPGSLGPSTRPGFPPPR